MCVLRQRSLRMVVMLAMVRMAGDRREGKPGCQADEKRGGHNDGDPVDDEPSRSLVGREGSGVAVQAPAVAIIWPCSWSPSSYATAGQDVVVPPQRCPGCLRRLVRWGGYWRWLRAPPGCGRSGAASAKKAVAELTHDWRRAVA